MATEKNNRSTLEELRELDRKRASLTRMRHFECEHNDGKVMYLSQYKGVVRNPEKYSETTVIHPLPNGCGAIFESRVYNKDEVEQMFFDAESLCHQIKMISGKGLSDKNKEDLYRCMEYIEYLKENLAPYYNSMVDALANDKNKQQMRGGRKVGGIGIDSSIFS